LDELGAALTDPRLKGATISIGGHTDAVGGDAFNRKLSERRAAGPRLRRQRLQDLLARH
jgi:outer membrane protein OmpA-like peptidoglycan-associated protein